MSTLNISYDLKRIAWPGNLLLICLLVSMIMGCSTRLPQSPNYFATGYDSYPTKFNKVALVADLTPPEIEVELGKTRGKGATEGIAEGALHGATYSLIAGPAYFLVLPYFVAAGVIGGAASGAASGYSAEMLAEAEAKSKDILDSAYMQKELLRRMQEYGNSHVDVEFIRAPSVDPEELLDKPDYTVLTKQSVDAVLEVELLQFALKSYGSNKLSSLIIQTRIRLVSTHTGKVLNDNRYEFKSSSYKFEDWLADTAALLTSEFERGLQTLAEGAIDEYFLLYYPKEPEKLSQKQDDIEKEQIQRPTDMGVPHYVLNPIYPKVDCSISCLFVETDSLQPTLKWEQFPRVFDLINADGKHNRITDVSYELRIFKLGPLKQIYYVRGIPEPYHKVEIELNACSKYKWTVRARFRLDGQTRVTEWGAAYNYNGWNEKPWNLRRGLYWYMVEKPSEWFYYRFKTPCNLEKINKK